MMPTTLPLEMLQAIYGDKVRENVSLAPYTSARIGGPADLLITANSGDELAEIVTRLWNERLAFVILGGGSNVLVSDKGVRGITILNRAKAIRFNRGDEPSVWAESGVVFSNLANRCVSKGYSGLEWAATVPGTIGGAVYGNAGAFGGDMAASLLRAELLTQSGREQWPVEKLGYGYRTSVLKRAETKANVLAVIAAEMRLKNATKGEVAARMLGFGERRRSTQPPGASMGSMFKNPAGSDAASAGRAPAPSAGSLIEAAGLKGARVGNAEISPVHGNFFINHGRTRASDVRALVQLVQRTVMEKFGVDLELEIEMIGEWDFETLRRLKVQK